ncbi:PrsW family intramembrane metalloprotease [Halostreptopolyspora alba]|uniref:Protease PrsW n=1 Tax=Halostreptopolyspora alba TaxID=2487137 RepID=A0A3N0E960_9ACTN|nr:protease PrsW [Nocardiopsaceae bacterium YIM 96095]
MQASQTPTPPDRTNRAWSRILRYGLVLWGATVLVTFVTGNTNLLPTIVLLGSFLVPVTFVAWAYEHARGDNVTVELLFSAFVIAGVLGVLGASLLERLLGPSPAMFIGIGVIEEGAKVAALVFVARSMAHRTPRDGLVLGATVGFGFAAFESAGYALNALVTERGLSLIALVETEILRGLLTPLGHGLWTAIVGCVLFAASAGRKWRVTLGVVATFVGVSLLHALWDSAHVIAFRLTMLLTSQPWQERLMRTGRVPELTPAQTHLITLMDWVGLAAISALGVLWLLRLWGRHSGRGNRSGPRDERPRDNENPPDIDDT